VGREAGQHRGGGAPFLSGAEGEVSTSSSPAPKTRTGGWSTGPVATGAWIGGSTPAATVTATKYLKTMDGNYEVTFSDLTTIAYKSRRMTSGVAITPINPNVDYDKASIGAEWLFNTLSRAGLIGR
jgi:hypothetical protein